MTFREILALPKRFVAANKVTVIGALMVLFAIGAYPSDLPSYLDDTHDPDQDTLVVAVETYARHVNTVVALAVPILLRDWTGLKQLGVVTVAGIVMTHGPKHLLDDLRVGDTRLGQRPHSPDSRHNMPSGHSALASAVIWFLGRRYSWLWALLTVPITGLTMHARVMLDAHTISAVLAGCLIGLFAAALFVTRRPRQG